MKAAIAYYSRHHGNTKQVLDALAQQFDITLIDVTQTESCDLQAYDVIGSASGIYYSRFHKSVLAFAERNLPVGKPVFFLYTCGTEKAGYTDAIRKVVTSKESEILGEFGCLGLDTFGPFKLVGGIAKGHPSREDLDNAAAFCANIFRENG